MTIACGFLSGRADKKSGGKMLGKCLTSLLLILLSYSGGPVPVRCNPDAKRLHDEILSGYNKLVRPVRNVTDPVTVKVKLKLSQLIDVVSRVVSPSLYN